MHVDLNDIEFRISSSCHVPLKKNWAFLLVCFNLINSSVLIMFEDTQIIDKLLKLKLQNFKFYNTLNSDCDTKIRILRTPSIKRQEFYYTEKVISIFKSNLQMKVGLNEFKIVLKVLYMLQYIEKENIFRQLYNSSFYFAGIDYISYGINENLFQCKYCGKINLEFINAAVYEIKKVEQIECKIESNIMTISRVPDDKWIILADIETKTTINFGLSIFTDDSKLYINLKTKTVLSSSFPIRNQFIIAMLYILEYTTNCDFVPNYLNIQGGAKTPVDLPLDLGKLHQFNIIKYANLMVKTVTIQNAKIYKEFWEFFKLFENIEYANFFCVEFYDKSIFNVLKRKALPCIKALSLLNVSLSDIKEKKYVINKLLETLRIEDLKFLRTNKAHKLDFSEQTSNSLERLGIFYSESSFKLEALSAEKFCKLNILEIYIELQNYSQPKQFLDWLNASLVGLKIETLTIDCRRAIIRSSMFNLDLLSDLKYLFLKGVILDSLEVHPETKISISIVRCICLKNCLDGILVSKMHKLIEWSFSTFYSEGLTPLFTTYKDLSLQLVKFGVSLTEREKIDRLESIYLENCTYFLLDLNIDANFKLLDTLLERIKFKKVSEVCVFGNASIETIFRLFEKHGILYTKVQRMR